MAQNAAEDLSTAPTLEDGASEDRMDQIADLLVEDSTEDSTEEATPTDELPTEDEDSDEESDETTEEESDLEAIAENEDTWESVLGVKQGQVNFDEEGNLVGFNVKVDGEVTNVKTADLIAGFQNNKSFTQKSQALAEERKTFESQREQLVNEYTTKLGHVAGLTQYFEKQLVDEYNSVNWDELRARNPGEHAALRQDFSERAMQMKQIQQAIATDSQKHAEGLQKQAEEQRAKFMETQNEKLVSLNPTWQDETVRNQAINTMKDFANETYGVTGEEFDAYFDARLVSIIQDAQRFRTGKNTVAKKLNQPLPTFQKSSGKQKAKPTKLQKLTAAAKNAKGANKRDLESQAVAELLIGN